MKTKSSKFQAEEGIALLFNPYLRLRSNSKIQKSFGFFYGSQEFQELFIKPIVFQRNFAFFVLLFYFNFVFQSSQNKHSSVWLVLTVLKSSSDAIIISPGFKTNFWLAMPIPDIFMLPYGGVLAYDWLCCCYQNAENRG